MNHEEDELGVAQLRENLGVHDGDVYIILTILHYINISELIYTLYGWSFFVFKRVGFWLTRTFL